LGGDDVVEGGVGDDKVYGGPGGDNMMGAGAMDSNEPGDDMVYGGPGRDDIGGDRGDDVLYGGEGDDHQVHGWYGDDTLYGGPGDDEGINAGEGEDTLYGGEGNDQVLAGGDGQRDELYCGDGTDTYTADEIDVVADDCEEKTKEEGPQKVEECPPNALCAPPNEHRVPDVVGMTVPEAYRTLSRSGYGCAIWAERSGQQAGPRRVAAQKEKPGSKGFAAQLIHLTVSKPYPEGYHHPGKGLLPPDCVDQRNYPR
jgi:RTX calcium-binding nonapeptide repeat (4 copies)